MQKNKVCYAERELCTGRVFLFFSLIRSRRAEQGLYAGGAKGVRWGEKRQIQRGWEKKEN